MIEKYQKWRPRFGQRAYVAASATVIGRVRCGDDVSVWPATVVRGDVNEIVIGDRTNVQDGSVLHVTHDGPRSPGGVPLIIGDDVTVAHKVILHACHVDDRCLIGMGAIVMDGAVLEREVLLAAGSLVPPGQRLQARALYRGSPARRVRDLTAAEIDQLAYSAQHYVRLKDSYLADRD